jgi:hypothetical protein
MIFECFVQSIEDEGQRVLLAEGEWAAQRLLHVFFRDPRSLEERSVVDELSERRPCGYARCTAVDLEAGFRQDVALDPDREAGDVTARCIPRLPEP